MKGVEFFLHEAQTRAENEAPFGDIVDDGNLFGDLQRMKQRQLHNTGANFCALSFCRKRSGKCERCRQIAVWHLVMLWHEEGLESQLFRKLRLLEDLIVEARDLFTVRRILRMKQETEFHDRLRLS